MPSLIISHLFWTQLTVIPEEKRRFDKLITEDDSLRPMGSKLYGNILTEMKNIISRGTSLKGTLIQT